MRHLDISIYNRKKSNFYNKAIFQKREKERQKKKNK